MRQLNTLKKIWNIYIKIMFLVFINGHVKKDGYINQSSRMNYELAFFIAFGAFWPALPFVVILKELTSPFLFQYWLFIGFSIYFVISIIIGINFQTLIDQYKKV